MGNAVFVDAMDRKAEFRLRSNEAADALAQAMKISVLVSEKKGDVPLAYKGEIENSIFSLMEQAYALGQSDIPFAAIDVIMERRRQVDDEGWTAVHDDKHADGQLAGAAACYALYGTQYFEIGSTTVLWPWGIEWWKPGPDRRRNLVKAGALLLAEIERLDRASSNEEVGASGAATELTVPVPSYPPTADEFRGYAQMVAREDISFGNTPETTVIGLVLRIATRVMDGETIEDALENVTSADFGFTADAVRLALLKD